MADNWHDIDNDLSKLTEPPKRPRRFRKITVRTLLPNMVTLLALCAGLTAIRMAFEGRYELAVAAVLLAGFLDGLDGRIARALKGATKFGAELDSLADAVNFGVVPALMMYLWAFQDQATQLGWIVVLLFAVCCALRLARFNVSLEDPDKPAWSADFFKGVPAPMGAILALLPLYISHMGFENIHAWPIVIIVYMAAIAALMVSRVPTFSGKKLGHTIPREMVLPVMVGLAFFAAMLFTFTWTVLSAVALLYLCSIPFSAWRYRMLAGRG